METGNRIIVNTGYLITGNFAARLITASTTLLLARYLSAAEFGLLSVAIALTNIASSLSKMSLNHTMIREGTKPHTDLGKLFSGALKLRMAITLVATLIFIAFIKAIYGDSMLGVVAYLVVIPSLWGGSLINIGEIYYQIVQRMQYTAILRSIPGVMVALFLLVGMLVGLPLVQLAFAYGFASLISGFVGLVVIYKKIPKLSGWHPGLLKGWASFAVGGIVMLLIAQLGPLLLERTCDLAQVGYFSLAFRVAALLYTFPAALASAFYPKLHYYGNQDPSHHLELNLKEIKYMGLLGVVLALPFALYPDWAIGFLFGEKWVEGVGPVLSVMIWAVVLQSINGPLADALATKGFQVRRSMVFIIGLVSGSLLYLTLGMHLGAQGGAWAAVSIEAILLVGLLTANPSHWLILGGSLLPHVFIVSLGITWGVAVKTFVPWQIIGFVIMPIGIVAFYLLFDRYARNQILSLAIGRRLSNG